MKSTGKTTKSGTLMERLTESKTLKNKPKDIEYELRKSLGGGVDLIIMHDPTLHEIQRVTKKEFPGVKPNQLQIVRSSDIVDGLWIAQVDDKHVTPPYDWFDDLDR